MKKLGKVSQSMLALAGKPQPIANTRGGSEYPIPACRRGKKVVMVWLEPEAAALLREISYETGEPKQKLMRDAVNWLLRTHGKAEIA